MMKPSETLSAYVIVKRRLYPQGEFTAGDFAILSCDIYDIDDGIPYNDYSICVKGNVFSCNEGCKYYLKGTYVHDRYGDAYAVKRFEASIELETEEERAAFIHTITRTDRQRELLRKLPDPLEAIKNEDRQAMLRVGLRTNEITAIIRRYVERFEVEKAYIALSKFGLSLSAVRKVLDKWGSLELALAKINGNPYLLVSAIKGIGWKTADDFALKSGFTPDDPRRIQAAVLTALDEQAELGHTWSTPQIIWEICYEKLALPSYELLPDQLRSALDSLQKSLELWVSEDRKQLGLSYLHDMEQSIADELFRLMSVRPKGDTMDYGLIEEVEEKQGWQFTKEQLNALKTVLNNNVVIITGAAGTGKTSVVTGALKLLHGRNFAQCALSGRAAARLGEVTGQAGQTIHRLLGYNGTGFTHDKDNPLWYDIVILDEVSMVGADIFLKLIQAIPTGSKLIMLGDEAQLESIGLCNVFKDMLDSGVIPVGRLTQIHRQASKSAIITESAKVRQGIDIIPYGFVGEDRDRGQLNDLIIDADNDPLAISEMVMDHYQQLLDKGITSDDIQVVVPMRQRGPLSIEALNLRIQALVNPNGKEAYTNKTGKRLCVGDRVICVNNMYNLFLSEYGDKTEDVFNGDRGKIIRCFNDSMVIDWDAYGVVPVPKGKWNNIELGYALTCHKLQGSESPYVIVGMDMYSRMLLTKEWLYTAMTRAKKQCIICAESFALTFASRHSNVNLKRTLLKDLLREEENERKACGDDARPADGD